MALRIEGPVEVEVPLVGRQVVGVRAGGATVHVEGGALVHNDRGGEVGDGGQVSDDHGPDELGQAAVVVVGPGHEPVGAVIHVRVVDKQPRDVQGERPSIVQVPLDAVQNVGPRGGARCVEHHLHPLVNVRQEIHDEGRFAIGHGDDDVGYTGLPSVTVMMMSDILMEPSSSVTRRAMVYCPSCMKVWL